MAASSAPTLSKGQIGDSLRQHKKKENKSKASGQQGKRVTKKNILLSPYKPTWPPVPQESENEVLDQLVLRLKDFPRLCPEREKEQVSNAGDSTEKMQSSDDVLICRRIRSQLAIGHRQVSKHLEKDQLALLLVWGGAQPSILTNSLIPLASTRSCPALYLPNLMPKVMAVTGLTSLVALGFKKIQPGLDDFKEFIAMATKLAPPLDLPWATGRQKHADEEVRVDEGDDAGEDSEEDMEERVEEKDKPTTDSKAESSTHLKIDWPVLADSDEQQILGKLTSLLEPYQAVLKTRKKKFQTGDWKRKRNTLRSQILTDVATVCDASKRGKLTLLLMQRDSLSNTLTETTAVSAVEHGCPVVFMLHLKETLSPVLRNPLLSAIAFRKCEDSKKMADFSDFVAFASKFVSKDLKSLLPKKEPAHAHKAQVKDTESSARVAKKPPIPVYNVSHLYVYKTDTKKPVTTATGGESTDFISLSAGGEEGESRRRKVTLKEPTLSYISLSSEPDVQVIGAKLSDSCGAESTDVAFIDTRGSKPFKDKPNKNVQDKDKEGGEQSHAAFVGILGMDDDDSTGTTTGTPFVPEMAMPSRKVKSALKRKLENSEASGQYVSFKFSPTNVQTSTSNPNKVKRKKKK